MSRGFARQRGVVDRSDPDNLTRQLLVNLEKLGFGVSRGLGVNFNDNVLNHHAQDLRTNHLIDIPLVHKLYQRDPNQ